MIKWIKNRKEKKLINKLLIYDNYEINRYIADLKAIDYSIIRTMGVICKKLKVCLDESRDLVLNLPTWINEKDRFIEFNNKAWEVLKEEADKVEKSEDGKVRLTFNINENNNK